MNNSFICSIIKTRYGFQFFIFPQLLEKTYLLFDRIKSRLFTNAQVNCSSVKKKKKIEEKWKFENIVAPSFSACLSFFFSRSKTLLIKLINPRAFFFFSFSALNFSKFLIRLEITCFNTFF